MYLKNSKAFFCWHSFLTTAAEYSFKHLEMQCPHTNFKLKCFVFILKQSFYNNSYNKEASIMALPCSIRAVFTTCFVYKGHVHQLLNSPQLQLPYKRKGKPKTCLTNHKGSISHHITPLVINSLRGWHTHAYSHHEQIQFQENKSTLAV